MLTTEENKNTDQAAIRYIKNSFPESAGILFVIETNKQLREELEEREEEIAILQNNINYWKEQAQKMLKSNDKIMTELEAARITLKASSKLELANNLKHANEKNKRLILEIEGKNSRLNKIKIDRDYYCSRAARFELKLKQNNLL